MLKVTHFDTDKMLSWIDAQYPNEIPEFEGYNEGWYVVVDWQGSAAHSEVLVGPCSTEADAVIEARLIEQ